MRERRKEHFDKRTKGSITLETALILPFFLFAVLVFCYFFQIMFIQEQISQGLWETAKEASRYAVIYQDMEESEESSAKDIAKKWGAGILVKTRMCSYVKDSLLDNSCICGGSNGVIYQARIYQGDYSIKLVATYWIEIPMFGSILPKLTMVQQVKTRGFVGTDKIGLSSEELEAEDIFVYVTDTGSVYHGSLGCSHLHLSIESTVFQDVNNLRNSGGGKYKPCDKCVKNVKLSPNSTIYITEDGDKYHKNLNCSGLIRNINKVKLSTLDNVRACQRCGG
ncbi:MAG: hypothetical protein II992_06060 [Lachnospiraceae bacterium]|nr:hypothetical protein [Lachnospiraceae bacterium]